MNNAPFYVGQEVVAIRDSMWIDFFKKGKKYHVLELKKCTCGKWQINVGYTITYPTQICSCSCFLGYEGQPAWHDSKHFAPIERTRINYVVKEVEVDAEIVAKAKETILETTQTN